MNKIHEPVLLEEILRHMHIKNQGNYIDATEGAGGYTKAILEKGGNILGIDADESMLKIAKENLRDVSGKAHLVHGNFKDITKIAKENGLEKVDGIVFDLGVSNVHFSDRQRGFSFRNPEANLDMRLNPNSQTVKASDLLNVLRIDQLKEMFESNLARKIVEFRKTKKFEKVGDLTSLFPKKVPGKLHPATKAFMSLRIAVNSELDNLRQALPQGYELLKTGGKLVVVSFHSLEDGIVKNFMRNTQASLIKSKDKKTKPIKPRDEEIKRNPKSRSAVMRVLEKI